MARVEQPDYQDRYPMLCGLLRTSLPSLPRRQPHVFRTFVKYTKLSPADAQRALTYGSPPIVRVADLQKKYAAYAGSGDVIVVQRLFLLDLESATGFTGVLALLESKILHEMVHWGWFKTQQSYYEPRSRHGDYGWDFEAEAWGRPQSVHSTGLAHIIPDPTLPRMPVAHRP